MLFKSSVRESNSSCRELPESESSDRLSKPSNVHGTGEVTALTEFPHDMNPRSSMEAERFRPSSRPLSNSYVAPRSMAAPYPSPENSEDIISLIELYSKLSPMALKSSSLFCEGSVAAPVSPFVGHLTIGAEALSEPSALILHWSSVILTFILSILASA